MSYIKELENVPDVDLLGDTSLETIRNEYLALYSQEYERITGSVPDLRESNPFRIIMNADSMKLYQALALIDRSYKQNLLKYATGAALDNIGALKKVFRESAAPAHTVLKFYIEEARSEPVGIPAGTRVSSEDEKVFSTEEYAEIPPGEVSVEVTAIAEEAGDMCNRYAAGTITEIMESISYITSAENITESSGGKDIQKDDDYTLDIFNAPKGTSMGGPEDAYEAKAYKFRPDVYDVKSISPKPCYVDVYFTLDDGKLPEESDIKLMEEYFEPKSMRPMGDRVSAKVPEEVEFNIELTYYISESNAAAEEEIKGRIIAAVEEYKTWQRKMGVDINPSKLYEKVMVAGAKRIDIKAPVFAKIYKDGENGVQISKLAGESVSYGGLEE